MKSILVYLQDLVLEYYKDRKPMSDARFKAVCCLVAAAIYVALVIGIAVTCGFFGVLAVGVFSVLAGLFIAEMFGAD